MKTKHVALFILFLIQIGCPVTCIVNPMKPDTLTRGRFEINGVLLEYEDDELQGPATNVDMPCAYDFFGASALQYYLGEGSPRTLCETESDSTGFFSLNLELPEAGLYKFNFTAPINQPQSVVITLLPNIEPSDDQPVFIDWEAESYSLIYQATRNFLVEKHPSLREGELVYWAYEVMTEVERMFHYYYRDYRVYLVEDSAPGVQTVSMLTCGGAIDGEGCSGWYRGQCYVDFNNLNPSESLCEIIVPAILSESGYYPADRLSETVQDAARAIAVHIAHEVGHALGLVDRDFMWGQSTLLYDPDGDGNYTPEPEYHNPYEPSWLAATRMLRTSIVGELPSYLPFTERCRRVHGDDEALRLPVERCPHRFNSFNDQYLDIVQ